jgi:hypothetical protein
MSDGLKGGIAEEPGVACPKCGKPATERVIKRDGQCSRCTQADADERTSAQIFALAIVRADIPRCRPADVADVGAYAAKVWVIARALAKEGRKA